MEDTYNIEVTIRVTHQKNYETQELAAATIKDRAPWDEIKPTAVRDALDSVLEEATGRVNRQLKAEHVRRREIERAAEIEAEASAE